MTPKDSDRRSHASHPSHGLSFTILLPEGDGRATLAGPVKQRKQVFRTFHQLQHQQKAHYMVAFTLTGLITSIVLAYVTNCIAVATMIMTNAANQQLCALMASVKTSSFSHTTVPSLGTPSTPVLKAQSRENYMPPLDLDGEHKLPSLITASPYAQNEGLTFPKGTSFWQPKSGIEATSPRPKQSPTVIITESSFDKNEGLKFPPGTSLWQPTSPTTARPQAISTGLWTPANASTSKTSSSASLSMRLMTTPLPASNLITASPYCSNESLKIPAGTSMWQADSAAAPKEQKSIRQVSLITASPYDSNETVSFPKGTILWQPKA